LYGVAAKDISLDSLSRGGGAGAGGAAALQSFGQRLGYGMCGLGGMVSDLKYLGSYQREESEYINRTKLDRHDIALLALCDMRGIGSKIV
jgi:hypothetical protein